MANKISNIEQERAKFAFSKANKYKSDDFSSYVKKFPMYIKVNGFTNTMAFVYSKLSNKAWSDIYRLIWEWLRQEPQGIISNELRDFSENNKEHLIEIIVNLPTEKLRLITSEILALFNWLKRFV